MRHSNRGCKTYEGLLIDEIKLALEYMLGALYLLSPYISIAITTLRNIHNVNYGLIGTKH